MASSDQHYAVFRRSVVGMVAIVTSLASALPLRAPVTALEREKETCKFCQDWPEATFDWKLCDEAGKPRVPSRNNLGGLGPNKAQEKEIRYDNVVNYNGEKLDLIVRNLTEYVPYDIKRNVVQGSGNDVNDVAIHGCFGVINVRHDTSVKLRFAFKPHGESFDTDWALKDGEKVAFSVWDVDHSLKKKSEERVTFQTKDGDGNVIIKDSNAQSLAKVLKNDREHMEVGSVVAGKGSDNPLNVSSGKEKSIEIHYRQPQYWDVAFESRGGTRGRNLLFHGCRSCPTPVPEPIEKKVECWFTIKSRVTDVYYNGKSIIDFVEGDLDDVNKVKRVIFPEVTGAILAIGGVSEGGGKDCSSGGFSMKCETTQPNSVWNGFEAKTSTVYATGSETTIEGSDWVSNDVERNRLFFSQPACVGEHKSSVEGELKGASMIWGPMPEEDWGSNKFSYFRMPKL